MLYNHLCPRADENLGKLSFKDKLKMREKNIILSGDYMYTHDFFLHIFLLEIYEGSLILVFCGGGGEWIPCTSKKKPQIANLINTWITKSEV